MSSIPPPPPSSPPPGEASGAPSTGDGAGAVPPPPSTEEPGTDPEPDVGADPADHRPRTHGTRFVFIDTETTGLDHRRHELTEVAWIVRYEDGREEQRQFFPEHTVDGADPDALELTHYHDRIAPQPKTPASEWLPTFLEDARDAVLVGAVPDFDARHLERVCFKLGLEPTWDHHLLDVETLALPLVAPGPEAPRSLAKTCSALGVPHDKDRAHGALYDAQQAMRVFDALWERIAQLRTDRAPLPEPVHRHGPTPRDEEAEPRSDDDATPDPTGSGAAPDPTVSR
jgi:DNA polymerase III epsilon subunit-like protein